MIIIPADPKLRLAVGSDLPELPTLHSTAKCAPLDMDGYRLDLAPAAFGVSIASEGMNKYRGNGATYDWRDLVEIDFSSIPQSVFSVVLSCGAGFPVLVLEETFAHVETLSTDSLRIEHQRPFENDSPDRLLFCPGLYLVAYQKLLSFERVSEGFKCTYL